jgi:hypothetical protein
MMNDQITVAKSDIPVLEKFINKMNKKALKFGLVPIEIKKIRDDVKERTVTRIADGEVLDKDTFDICVTVFEIVGNDSFQINGFEFVGTVDYLENSTIINKNPLIEEPVPDRFTTKDMQGVCEHCNINRFRKNIFIIREIETGEFKQVGKSCLKDFLDTASVAVFDFLASFYIVFKDVDEDGMWGGGGGSRDRSFKPVDIISFALAQITESGFVSSSRSQEMMITSTAQCVGYSMTTTNTKDVVFPSKEDDEKAENILKWCSELPEDSNEYLTKLGQLCRETGVTDRHIGILASAPVAYNNQMEFNERKLIDDERKEVADDVIEGNGLEVEGSIISFKEHYTDYGMSLKMIVQDVRGFRLWGTVPNSLCNVDVGDSIKFIANVSKSDTDPKFGFFKRPRKAVVV